MHVFEETLIDPIKTLRRDVYPRFLTSEFCKEMVFRCDEISQLPDPFSLRVPAPEGTFAAIDKLLK